MKLLRCATTCLRTNNYNSSCQWLTIFCFRVHCWSTETTIIHVYSINAPLLIMVVYPYNTFAIDMPDRSNFILLQSYNSFLLYCVTETL